MNFGWEAMGTEEEDAFRIMDRAVEHGINFVDTANVYGWREGGRSGEGITEQIIGRWFAQGGGRRDRVVLATKVFSETGDWPNESRLSALNIRRACDESLRRLQTDHIDLYQFHHVDRDAPWDEIWQAMETLVQAGKIVYVGSSNFAGWHIAEANEAARAAEFPRAGVRAMQVQPDRPFGRARGAAGVRALRTWRHPVQPARLRDPRRSAAEGERGQQVR